ncbi:hypothetical protein SHLI107390_01855 [Shewanella livingstonensis]
MAIVARRQKNIEQLSFAANTGHGDSNTTKILFPDRFSFEEPY